MTSALDTNILLDILLPDPSHVEQSRSLLDQARRKGALIISEVVYAELSAHFPSKGDLDRFLREASIALSDFLIGGHAVALAQTLLTRDRGYYRTYFSSLHLNKVSA